MAPAVGCGQVFGLASLSALAGFLLSVASQFPKVPVHVTEVVLAYRCGAAPDSHRVPSRAGQMPSHQHEAQHIGVNRALSNNLSWSGE